MNKLNAGTWLLGAAVGSFLTGMIMKSSVEFSTKETARPTAAFVTNDLNQDGIADLVIQTGYWKIPLYGTNGSYIPADKMQKLHPDSIIDYSKIEERLNKQ